MSTLEVKVRNDFQVLPHPNADRLELVQIGGEGGFISVVGKGQFKQGDALVYVPVDAVIPEEMSKRLSSNSKVVIGPRIRAARIRGLLSQGLCLRADEWLPAAKVSPGLDVAEDLGIKKYQPPEPTFKGGHVRGISITYQNENFDKYTDVEHFSKFPHVFNDQVVVVTTKYHGTNFRAGIVRKPYRRKGFLLRVLEKIGSKIGISVSDYEFLVGSHNVIRKVSLTIGTKASEDLYWKVANKYNIRKLAEKYLTQHPEYEEFVIYGEIVGPGIQKGYDYGVPPGDYELKVFDIKIDGKYQPWEWVQEYVDYAGLRTVDVLARGTFNLDMLKLAEATDEYAGKKHTREGIVIKSMIEKYDPAIGRVIAKHINPDYLTDTTNSDHH